jgi:hypothetical protein
MPPRPLAAAAVLTLALAGPAAGQGNPANPFFPDAAGTPVGPTVIPIQGYGAAPGPAVAGPPAGAAPAGGACLPADALGGAAGATWSPTCWVGVEYLLWWVRHGPVAVPLATGGPATGVGLINAPHTFTVLGNDSFQFNSFSGVRVLGGVWLTPSQTVGIEGDFFILPTKTVSNPPVLATDQFPTLARPFLDATTNAQNSRVLSRPGFFTGGIQDTADSLLWGAELLGSFRLWERKRFTLDGLTGFQFLDLEESLQVNDFANTQANGTATFAGRAFRSPATTFVEDRFTTLNRFYGGVVGLRGGWHIEAFTLALTAKVGLGSINETVHADGRTSLAGPFPTVVTTGGGFLATGATSGHFRQSEFTYIPEFAANLTVQVTPHLTFKGGYTYLYVDRVARPGNQLPTTINPTQVPSSANFGAVFAGRQPPFEIVHSPYFAQGLNVGVLYAF